MKRLMGFIYCLLVCLVVLLPRDSLTEARRSPLIIIEKDSTMLDIKNSQHLEISKVENIAVLEASHSKKEAEEQIMAVKNNGGEAIIEEEKVRELMEHIDYAGATTHPPSEPPKKKKTNSHQKSLRPPSRAHKK